MDCYQHSSRGSGNLPEVIRYLIEGGKSPSIFYCIERQKYGKNLNKNIVFWRLLFSWHFLGHSIKSRNITYIGFVNIIHRLVIQI